MSFFLLKIVFSVRCVFLFLRIGIFLLNWKKYIIGFVYCFSFLLFLYLFMNFVEIIVLLILFVLYKFIVVEIFFII